MPGVDSEYYDQADEHARMHNRPIRDPKAMLWEQIDELKARNAELVEALETAVFWLEGCAPHTEHTDHIWKFIAKAHTVLDKEVE